MNSLALFVYYDYLKKNTYMYIFIIIVCFVLMLFYILFVVYFCFIIFVGGVLIFICFIKFSFF